MLKGFVVVPFLCLSLTGCCRFGNAERILLMRHHEAILQHAQVLEALLSGEKSWGEEGEDNGPEEEEDDGVYTERGSK